eukprot:gene22210-63860_t
MAASRGWDCARAKCAHTCGDADKDINPGDCYGGTEQWSIAPAAAEELRGESVFEELLQELHISDDSSECSSPRR